MKLGLLLHDPEEEHDCFSDNTHNSHYYDIVGMLNVYNGRYVRIDGRQIQGPSLAALVGEVAPDLQRRDGREARRRPWRPRGGSGSGPRRRSDTIR